MNKTNKTTTKAVIYIRSSTAQSEERLNEQETRLRNYASQHDLDVVKVFQDYSPGISHGRSGYKEMVEFIAEHNGKPPMIISEWNERLSQDMRESAAIKLLGAQLHLVHEDKRHWRDNISFELDPAWLTAVLIGKIILAGGDEE